MLRSRLLEASTTKYLLLTVSLIILVTTGGFAIILAFKLTELEKLSKFVDAVFKAVAILLGTIWTLNRYYVGRTDTIRLKVDSDVNVVRYSKSEANLAALALLIFRLDVVNIGTVLIPRHQQSLEIHAVTPSSNGALYELLYRWPAEGKHPGWPIEPNSWSAINNAVTIPGDTIALRIYLEVELSEDSTWTWHKTFDVSKGVGNE